MSGGTLALPRPLSAYRTPATGTPVLPPDRRGAKPAQPSGPKTFDQLLLQYHRTQAKPGETRITIPMSEAARYFGLYPEASNIQAFGAWFNQLERPGMLGPREVRLSANATVRKDLANDPARVRLLQGALARRGYAVQATGAFDAATERAAVAFKRAYGLSEPFRAADGRPAVLPFVDERAYAAITGGVIAR